jgi:flavin-dependent dehydrogenase
MEAGVRAAGTIQPTIGIPEAAGRVWDAVVVGAGPGGSIAARMLAGAGRSVLLVDKAAFPREKVCGCCLSGAALHALERAGLGGLARHLGGMELRQLRLYTGGTRVDIEIQAMALSRSALDAGLVQEAIGAGASFLPAVAARFEAFEVARRETRGSDASIVLRAGSESGIVGVEQVLVADGIAGTCLGDRPEIACTSRIGLSTVVDSPFEGGVIRMVFGRGGYVGAVRLEDGRLNLAAAIDPGLVRQAGGPGLAVASILQDAGIQSPPGIAEARWHGTPALTRRRRRLCSRHLLVLGDAASYVEPFTGEGIGWAIASGLAAADLVLQRRPHDWPQTHARLIARRQRTCRAVAWLLRRPRLAGAAARTLALMPMLARPTVRRVQASLMGGGA